MDIPVTFEHKGEKISGALSELTGAGSNGGEWQLMVGGYYWGRLRLVNGQWFFDGNNKFQASDENLNHFAEVVTAWYQ